MVGWIQVPVRTIRRRPRVNPNPPPLPKIPPVAKGKGKARVSDVIALDDEEEEEEEFEEETMQYQLVALTYSGCWYRLSLPSSNSSSPMPLTQPVTSSTGSSTPTSGDIPIPQRTSHQRIPSTPSVSSSSSPPSHISSYLLHARVAHLDLLRGRAKVKRKRTRNLTR